MPYSDEFDTASAIDNMANTLDQAAAETTGIGPASVTSGQSLGNFTVDGRPLTRSGTGEYGHRSSSMGVGPGNIGALVEKLDRPVSNIDLSGERTTFPEEAILGDDIVFERAVPGPRSSFGPPTWDAPIDLGPTPSIEQLESAIVSSGDSTMGGGPSDLIDLMSLFS